MTRSRPLRADARRNRDRLLEAAVRAFSGDAGVPLDAIALDVIARDAGVGIGTLYRHFPTREALVEAAYRSEVARLCDSAPPLLAQMPPDRALRTWMDRFVAYVGAKRGMAQALHEVIASGGDPYAHSRDLILGAIKTLLDAGAAAGSVRGDVLPEDVFAGLYGLVTAAAEPGQPARLLDLLMAGLRRT